MRPTARALLDLVVPSGCAGCERPGPALCTSCEQLLGWPEQVRLVNAIPAFALGRYAGPLRNALLAYKERGRRELAGPIGRAVAAGLRRLPGWVVPAGGGWWLVPAPSRAAEARRRGAGPDGHVARLAEAAAAELAAAGTAAAVAPALRLASGVRDSVGLDAAERSANLAGRVQLRRAGLPPAGTSVVLLDDVITTGATAAACAAALGAAGLRVQAVVALAAVAAAARPVPARRGEVSAGAVAGAARQVPSRLSPLQQNRQSWAGDPHQGRRKEGSSP